MIFASRTVFVFGSNRAGIHGAGAAKFAFDHCGAVWGLGEGMAGDSYALPTCDGAILPLKLDQVRFHVDRFLDFAKKNPTLQFQVTRVGCGLAGFTDAQIAPLFVTAPDNVWLPSAFSAAPCRSVAPPLNHISPIPISGASSVRHKEEEHQAGHLHLSAADHGAERGIV